MAAAATAAAVSAPSFEAIDPRNMMPVFPQTPSAEQTLALSRDRETSSIPKADEHGNWVYPSPQQFYHALQRKNKEVEAEAMDAVVHVHNVTNENTWNHILEWEKLHHRECATPRLLRFLGRSEDLSWGAWWSKRLSYRGTPFDRHDWFVDRCGLQVVRYIIDYYDDPNAADRNLQITIEARPALDSFGAAVDRLRRPLWQVRRLWTAMFGGGGSVSA